MAGVGRVAQTRWILHRGRSRSAWMRWGRWSGCGGCRAAAAVASSAEVITIYHLTGETGEAYNGRLSAGRQTRERTRERE